MPGLVPGIHVFDFTTTPKDVDAQELVSRVPFFFYFAQVG